MLAAGEGSRMAPLTRVIPKALLPIAGKPVGRWVVERLVRQGFDVLFRVNEAFYPQFKHEFRDFECVSFSVGSEPMGTAGEIIDIAPSDTFIVYYGDELTDVDLGGLVEFHRCHGALVTLALITDIPLEVGVVELDGVRVVAFHEKPPLDKWSWAGIAVMEPGILGHILVGDDFARDVFPRAIERGEKILGFMSGAEWLDTGTPEHYRRAEERMTRGL